MKSLGKPSHSTVSLGQNAGIGQNAGDIIFFFLFFLLGYSMELQRKQQFIRPHMIFS